MKTIALYSQPYLDKTDQCYKNIITLSNIPDGPLSNYIVKIHNPYLSPFKNIQHGCTFAISKKIYHTHFNNNCIDYLITDETSILFSFLLENGYIIDTSISKMILQTDITFHTNNANNLLCFITYHY